MKLFRLMLVGFIICFSSPAFCEDSARFQGWVNQMKQSARGPFSRIRWFCSDGSVLEPKAYARQDHGGGVQHGEWSPEIMIMRDKGFMIGNVYADLVPDTLIKAPGHLDLIKQMILEQFLIRADDGWIFRKARYYRGALQGEDEARGGRMLLGELLETHSRYPERFLLLREAARQLPHHHQNAPASRMRQMSLAIAQTDKNFAPLRIKIHVRPEADDSVLVREYAQKNGLAELSDDYALLADTIDQVFRPKDLTPLLLNLAGTVKHQSFSQQLARSADRLKKETDPFVRFEVAGQLSIALRDNFVKTADPKILLPVMDMGILLEDEVFRLASAMLNQLPGLSVKESFAWLEQCCDVLYGTGLISNRQHTSLKARLKAALTPGQTLFQLREDLIYLSRASDWAEQNLKFHFSRTIDHFNKIEPISGRFVHDRLHTSILLAYSRVIERLMTDNNQQLGISSMIMGHPVSFGITGLNPGLSRGILIEPLPGGNLAVYPKDSILILPATTSELPPVSGIITAGRGNILSHVQLLARNLGIPNVAVDKAVLDKIRSYKNKKIVLAVSPKGIVQMAADSPEWDTVFRQKAEIKRTVLKADTQKLDLNQTDFISLGDIRTDDSGRIAGPKAANLGQLKLLFPKAVTDGVIIPFGLFRKMLDQPYDDSGTPMFEWMKIQYQVIAALKDRPAEQHRLIEQTLTRIRTWILSADPGEAFRNRLWDKLEKTLGPDGSYGVFVRSDTNVEDLPGFTGAGLNLTVPHVVGFDNILSAIRRVWASPFTLRSFGWRHAYLENPEHVYASVLLMKTVPVEKSGVMVTKNLATGKSGWLTVAVNEGVGGAVSGQTAEELSIQTDTGEVTLLSQATEPLKRIVLNTGGMRKVDAGGRDTLLSQQEISQLIALARQLPDKFPSLTAPGGQTIPADVEFGFLDSRLVLFQIRPLVDDAQTQKDRYLLRMDQLFENKKDIPAALDRIPGKDGT